jgi:hypothetical protein
MTCPTGSYSLTHEPLKGKWQGYYLVGHRRDIYDEQSKEARMLSWVKFVGEAGMLDKKTSPSN